MAARSGRTELIELTGSDDNVLVFAKATHIIDVSAHKPYQKGLLWDDSMQIGDRRPFVVYDPDIRLEKDHFYMINGYDHAYENLEEIQLLIHEGATVRQLWPDEE